MRSRVSLGTGVHAKACSMLGAWALWGFGLLLMPGCHEKTEPEAGACCLLNGTCEVRASEAECDGLWRGEGTSCSGGSCVAGGACCTGGSCEVVFEEHCAGTYGGDGTSCYPDPCSSPTGACCPSDGSCSVETEADCTSGGGSYIGDDEACDPDPCAQTGACCADTGVCTEGTATACASASGSYQGAGTDCSPNPCPVTGACCGTDNSCDVGTAADCSTAGGSYLGDNTGCSPNLCATVGGCCTTGGGCLMTDETTCTTTHSGTFEGVGSDCGDCPDPTIQWSAAAQTVGEAVGQVTVTATVSASRNAAISADFTVTGTAAQPADHSLVNGTVTVPAGALTGTVVFNVVDDNDIEQDETVILTMGNPTGATLGAVTVHTVTIEDNDAVPINHFPACDPDGIVAAHQTSRVMYFCDGAIGWWNPVTNASMHHTTGYTGVVFLDGYLSGDDSLLAPYIDYGGSVSLSYAPLNANLDISGMSLITYATGMAWGKGTAPAQDRWEVQGAQISADRLWTFTGWSGTTDYYSVTDAYPQFIAYDPDAQMAIAADPGSYSWHALTDTGTVQYNWTTTYPIVQLRGAGHVAAATTNDGGYGGQATDSNLVVNCLVTGGNWLTVNDPGGVNNFWGLDIYNDGSIVHVVAAATGGIMYAGIDVANGRSCSLWHTTTDAASDVAILGPDGIVVVSQGNHLSQYALTDLECTPQ